MQVGEMFLLAITGVLWYVNLTIYIKNVINKNDTLYQTIIGIGLTFGFIFMYLALVYQY